MITSSIHPVSMVSQQGAVQPEGTVVTPDVSVVASVDHGLV